MQICSKLEIILTFSRKCLFYRIFTLPIFTLYAQKSLESLQVIPKLSQNCLIDVPSCLKIVPKLSQGCLKIVSELSQNCLKVSSKFPQSCFKVVSKLSQSCRYMGLANGEYVGWHRNIKPRQKSPIGSVPLSPFLPPLNLNPQPCFFHQNCFSAWSDHFGAVSRFMCRVLYK